MKVIPRRTYKFLPYRFRLAQSLENHVAYAPPKVVQVEVTNLCNLRCVMCDRWKWAEEDSGASDVLGTRVLFNLFDEFANIGVERVLLTGGEPLIRRDFGALIGRISDLRMSTTIFTNGTLMDRERAWTLAAASAVVCFSVDGLAEAHDKIRGVPGTFDKAFKGIQNLIQARREGHFRGSVTISFTVQKSNIDDVVPMLSVANEVGVDAVTYNLVHGKPGMAPDERDLERLKKDLGSLRGLAAYYKTSVVVGEILQAFVKGEIPLSDVKAGLPSLGLFRNVPVPCLAAYTTSFIDGFGRVFPCCFCYLDNFSFSEFEEERRQFQMGSLLESSFSKIWYGEDYDRFRAGTDPVDVDDLSLFCGQCHNYFAFKRSLASNRFSRKSRRYNVKR